jgi:pimeloyl-ACP methyl ester carboxylesterase
MTTFQNIRVRFFERYEAQDYAGALALLTEHQAEIPEDHALIALWRVAMMARLGDVSNAISLLSALIAEGHWYHEGALQRDPDFASLQNSPEFQSILVECQARRAKAPEQAKASLVTLVPENAIGPMPLLIALHGGSSNATTDRAFWKPALDRGWLIALAQSSTISWMSGYYDWSDTAKGIDEIAQHISTLQHEYAIDPFSIVVGGFSQGGNLALEVALSNRVKVRGAIIVEGVEAPTFDMTAWTTKVNRCRDITIGVTLIAGADNPPYVQGNKLMAETLRAGYIRCVELYEDRPFHGFGPKFEQTLQHSLDFICDINAVSLHY